MSPVTALGVIVNPDQWDGYPAARDRFFDTLDELAIDNLVVMTGDIHSSWAGEIPRTEDDYDKETGDGSMGVELVAPGVTSGFPLNEGMVDLALSYNPHIFYGDVTHRGYMVVDVTHERTQASWYHLEDVKKNDPAESLSATFETKAGTNRLTEVTESQ